MLDRNRKQDRKCLQTIPGVMRSYLGLVRDYVRDIKC